MVRERGSDELNVEMGRLMSNMARPSYSGGGGGGGGGDRQVIVVVAIAEVLVLVSVLESALIFILVLEFLNVLSLTCA